jgi:hypothetical protein
VVLPASAESDSDWAGTQGVPDVLDKAALTADLITVFTDLQVGCQSALTHCFILNALVCMTISLQDMPALSALLARSFARGDVIAPELLTASLQVFQKHGDHA